MTLKEFVTACRVLSGLSQEEFTAAIGLTSAQSVSNYEKGRDRPSFAVLERIAKQAEVELDDCLVFWDPAMKQTREEENEEVLLILHDLLGSPVRDQIISYLRGFARTRRGKEPRRPRARPGADGHSRNEG